MPMHDLARVGFELGFPSSGDKFGHIEASSTNRLRRVLSAPPPLSVNERGGYLCSCTRSAVVPVTAPADLVRNRQEHQAEWADRL